MATAFDNEQYLIDWKSSRVYPKIHRDIFELFSGTFQCSAVLDMCCCTGLLGTHVEEFHGIPAYGLEGNPEWIQRGRKWGITMPILETWICEETLDDVTAYIRDHQINGMLARRCLSELFAYDRPQGKKLQEPKMDWARKLTESLVEAGIREVWAEGGRPIVNADKRKGLPMTELSLKCWEPAYRVSEWRNQCVYLVANDG